MATRNDGTDENGRIQLRVGINSGDVIVEDGDIHGDGVNIAARLEGIAEPGRICVSGIVHDQVRARLDCTFTDIGEQRLKNIARRVRVYWAALNHPDASSPPVRTMTSAVIVTGLGSSLVRVPDHGPARHGHYYNRRAWHNGHWRYY